jgi:hypothetical protein
VNPPSEIGVEKMSKRAYNRPVLKTMTTISHNTKDLIVVEYSEVFSELCEISKWESELITSQPEIEI